MQNIDIYSDDEGYNIKIECDSCDNKFKLICDTLAGLSQCPYCGTYLDLPTEEDNEEEEDSWD